MEQEVWCGGGAFAGYICVTRKQMGGLLAVGAWVTFLQPVMGCVRLSWLGVGCENYIFVTRDWVMLLGCGRGCIEWVLFVVGQCKIHAHKLDYSVIISYICK